MLQMYCYNSKLHTWSKIIVICLNFGNNLRVFLITTVLTTTCNIFPNFDDFKIILLNVRILEL